jgi:ribosomal protein S18 acetylase RimI-like enzyme
MEIRAFNKQYDIPLYVEGDVEAWKESYPGVTLPLSAMSEIERGFKNYVSDDNCCAFTAIENEQPIGFVIVTLEFFIVIPQGYISSIYVKPKYRGKGIGAALIGQAESWAKAKGAKSIKLDVSRINETAISTYEKSGFVTTRYQMDKAL